jgi:uncharacterized membrane protein YwaF
MGAHIAALIFPTRVIFSVVLFVSLGFSFLALVPQSNLAGKKSVFQS